jgi:hypothetical protein
MSSPLSNRDLDPDGASWIDKKMSDQIFVLGELAPPVASRHGQPEIRRGVVTGWGWMPTPLAG